MTECLYFMPLILNNCGLKWYQTHAKPFIYLFIHCENSNFEINHLVVFGSVLVNVFKCFFHDVFREEIWMI